MFNLKSIIPLICIILFSLSSFAQNKDGWKNKTPEEIAEKRAAKLKEKLSLSDYQHKQIYDIILKSVSEIKSLREQKKSTGEVDRKVLREKIKSLRKETHDKIVSVLTPEQRAKFDEVKKKKMEKRKEHKQKSIKKNKK
ncbi:MAG: Spy/CpxP family protein refolding chaperone [Ignavibacteria bacterium]|nr:Spy/CpxP family protein refolding chaperone [Ignavibacteria bacterium]